MAHIRKQIRDAVLTALIHNTSAKGRVFSSRGRRLDQDELPAIVILTPDDSVAAGDKDKRKRHDLDLWVVLAGKATDDTVQDSLDALAVEVETLISPDIPGITTHYEELARSRFEMSPEGAEDFAFLTLEFEIQYHAIAGDPETFAT